MEIFVLISLISLNAHILYGEEILAWRFIIQVREERADILDCLINIFKEQLPPRLQHGVWLIFGDVQDTKQQKY